MRVFSMAVGAVRMKYRGADALALGLQPVEQPARPDEFCRQDAESK